ncbi:MAG: winged helix DNA-binding domain-containing protein [Acidimicrobiia bacterium]|nr:winged helix DNA-binding domain-containing protein [Acidimicrobiia bacterium]
MGSELSLRRLNRATLDRQGLLDRHRGTIPDVISGLAGLQAQHANSPYVALWARRHGQTIANLESALTQRTVVKATIMRATLHLVSADDFFALDRATAEARVAVWRPTAKKVDIDLLDLNAALRGFCNEPRMVAEMNEYLDDLAPGAFQGVEMPNGVLNSGFRMASAGGGLVHVPPSGLWKSHGKPRYIDARIWLDGDPQPELTEAMVTTIERYLSGYGPATEQDIMKWAGLRRVTDVRKAVAALGDSIITHVGPDGTDYLDLADAAIPDEDIETPPRFLARWDSVLIGYKDRARILPDVYKDAVIKKNGDFLPTFLIDGLVAGLWSVETVDDEAVLSLAPFSEVTKGVRTALEVEGEDLARYLEPEAANYDVVWTSAP